MFHGHVRLPEGMRFSNANSPSDGWSSIRFKVGIVYWHVWLVKVSPSKSVNVIKHHPVWVVSHFSISWMHLKIIKQGKKRWFFATDWARYMFYSQVCVCVCLRACTCMQGIEYIYIYLHIISYTCICLHICNYILILIYKLLHTPVSHPYARCWSYSFVTHNIKSTFIPVSWIHAPHNMKFYILPSTGGVLAGFVGACASLAEASSAFWAARRRPRCNVCPKHPEKISTQLPPAFLVRNHE